MSLKEAVLKISTDGKLKILLDFNGGFVITTK